MGCKDIGTRKPEFVAKTQFLCDYENIQLYHYQGMLFITKRNYPIRKCKNMIKIAKQGYFLDIIRVCLESIYIPPLVKNYPPPGIEYREFSLWECMGENVLPRFGFL